MKQAFILFRPCRLPLTRMQPEFVVVKLGPATLPQADGVASENRSDEAESAGFGYSKLKGDNEV